MLCVFGELLNELLLHKATPGTLVPSPLQYGSLLSAQHHRLLSGTVGLVFSKHGHNLLLPCGYLAFKKIQQSKTETQEHIAYISVLVHETPVSAQTGVTHAGDWNDNCTSHCGLRFKKSLKDALVSRDWYLLTLHGHETRHQRVPGLKLSLPFSSPFMQIIL